MINKKNLWFVTLFSLILILGIYYVSIDDEVQSVLKTEENIEATDTMVEITPSDVLVSLEVEKDEEKQTLMAEYQNILLDEKASLEEKNNAYESIQKLTTTSKDENKIKKIIKEKYSLDSFIKIKDNNINVIIASKKHDKKLANDIIRSVQELYPDEKYITVKFNTEKDF